MDISLLVCDVVEGGRKGGMEGEREGGKWGGVRRKKGGWNTYKLEQIYQRLDFRFELPYKFGITVATCINTFRS